MDCSYIIYILSIALQVAGALLLMIFALSTKRGNIIRRFVARNLIVRDSDEKLKYDVAEFKNSFKTAWLSRFSFGYIAVGYLAGIYGELGENRSIVTMFLIAVATMALMGFAYFVTFIILKLSRDVNKKLTLGELRADNIDPNLTFMSTREFNERWEAC